MPTGCRYEGDAGTEQKKESTEQNDGNTPIDSMETKMGLKMRVVFLRATPSPICMFQIYAGVTNMPSQNYEEVI